MRNFSGADMRCAKCNRYVPDRCICNGPSKEEQRSMTTKPEVEIDLDRLQRFNNRGGLMNPEASGLYVRYEELAQARASQAVAEPVMKCWSCKREYSAEQRLDADGNCPHCGVEIEEYAAPVAQQSEAGDLGDLTAKISALTCAPHPAGYTAKEARMFNIGFYAGTSLSGEAVKAFASQPVEAGAPTAAAEPTDLSKRLRALAAAVKPNGPALVTPKCLLDAADEIERYYGGMMAWKKTAEKKDADWSAERMARIDERCAARAEAVRESAAPLAQQDALEQLIAQHRIAITPEYEGGFRAEVYRDEEKPQESGYGQTPRAAVDAAMQKGAQ